MKNNDNVLRARDYYGALGSGQTLYIRQEKNKYWVTMRSFVSVEVEWDWLFPVTLDEAMEIVENQYAFWHWTIKPWSIR